MVIGLVCVCVFLTTSHHDQVHKRYRVEADVPQPHDAKHVDQDHGDGDGDNNSWPQLKAQQHCRHHKYGCQGHAQVQSRVIHDGQVLLVKHIEHATREEKKSIHISRMFDKDSEQL